MQCLLLVLALAPGLPSATRITPRNRQAAITPAISSGSLRVGALETQLRDVVAEIQTPANETVFVDDGNDFSIGEGPRFGTQTRYVYIAVAIIMDFGAIVIHNLYFEETNRDLQRRGALALMTCCVLHLAVALVGVVPPTSMHYLWDHLPGIWEHTTYPEIVVHYLEDYVVMPCCIMNLGYLAGLKPKDRFPCIMLVLLSTTACIGAAVFPAPEQRVTLWASALVLMVAARQKFNEVTLRAQAVSDQNKQRVQGSGELLAWSLVAFPALQGLGLFGVLSMPRLLQAFAVLDVIFKFGAVYLMMKDGRAIREAEAYLAEEEARGHALEGRGGARIAEPHNEQPARGVQERAAGADEWTIEWGPGAR